MNTQADLPDLPDLPDLAEMVSATAARSLPSTRAGGQDYGSLTNSLKLTQIVKKTYSNNSPEDPGIF